MSRLFKSRSCDRSKDKSFRKQGRNRGRRGILQVSARWRRGIAYMPTQEAVRQLIHYVESGRTEDALDEFYTDDVTMAENLNPPTTGKAANICASTRSPGNPGGVTGSLPSASSTIRTPSWWARK